MWQATTERARRDIAALSGRGLGVSEVHRRAIDVVTRVVPAEMTCWGVLDPASLLISSMVGGEESLPEAFGPLLAAAEYDGDEPHTFAGLARQHRDVALLSDLPQHDRDRSARLRTVWEPLGLDREVRVVFSVDGASWGAAGMVRAGRDFTPRETEFLAVVAPAVARATRDAVREEVSVRSAAAAVAVVLLDDDGHVRSLTPGAERWREAVEATSPGRFRLLMQMVAAATRSAAGSDLLLRVRDGQGGWTTVSGSRLHAHGPSDGSTDSRGGPDGTGGVVVTAASVGDDDLVELLLGAYGLSRRERDVSREVMAGGSTVEIAARLFVSPHTVQDHLKSVFDKVGVRSRVDLVARLRPGVPSQRD